METEHHINIENLPTPILEAPTRVWHEPRFKITVWRQQVHDHGKEYTYHYAGFDRREPGVVIVPINSRNEILLGWHYRVAIHQWSLELPRGSGAAGESVVESAARELSEETGMTAIRLDEIASIHADGGILRDDVRIVKAYVGCQNPGVNVEELNHAEWYTREQVRAAIRNGRISCALTLAALSFL